MSEKRIEKYVSEDGIFVYRMENGAGEMIGYEGAAQRLLLPAYVSDCLVTAIGKKTFAGKRQLVKLCLPDTLEKIGDRAFAGCHRLKEITLPNRQLHLGRQLFGKCTALRELVYCAEEDMLAKQQSCLREQICRKIRVTLLRLTFSDCMEQTVRRVLLTFLQERMGDCREEIWNVIEDSGEEQFLYCDVLLETGMIGNKMIGEILEELGENHVELRAYLLRKWQSGRKASGFWEQLQL